MGWKNLVNQEEWFPGSRLVLSSMKNALFLAVAYITPYKIPISCEHAPLPRGNCTLKAVSLAPSGAVYAGSLVGWHHSKETGSCTFVVGTVEA
mmetsp:Transcript_25549/g.59920  ORF Transcript_25549/g.59920 Transcript_25549/m.59920 type:complete len:93 (+) Transcript_25549:657-935(+)